MDAPLSSDTISPGSGQHANRKERGAIAAQACERCRNRKQRCDEQRPKCGTCQRFKFECRYREPQPTKKDKTLVEILERLKSVENKIDSFCLRDDGNLPAFSISHPPDGTSTLDTPILADLQGNDSLAGSSLPSVSPVVVPLVEGYRYDSSASRILDWPVMRQILDSLGQKSPSFLNVNAIPSVFRGTRESITVLPPEGVQNMDIPTDNTLSVPLQLSGTINLNLSPPSIGWETMQRLSKSYFDTFNLLYPILDRQWFNSNTLSMILNQGFQETAASSLVLLVLALGDVSLSTSDVPITAYKGRPSGIRGGSMGRPPGLAYFNEARKRIGFVLAEVSIENVQMLALAALYHASCGQARESCQMTVLASLACQVLISSKPDLLRGPRADLIKRIFFHCSIMETYMHIEFGLPLTGLDKMDEAIGLPDFNGQQFTDDDFIRNQTTHFQEHFNSHVTLRRLSAKFHSVLSNVCETSSSLSFSETTSFSSRSSDACLLTIKQFAAQLDQWRSMLPAQLRWLDHQSTLPGSSQDSFSNIYADQSMQDGYTFTADLDTPSTSYPYTADLHAALLRSHYYYTRFLIYRPCVYKVLHFPESMTREDADGAAECLKASLKWPIAMSPPCTNKRLVPTTFFWSQNFFGILILLHLSQQHPILSQIRSSLCGQHFETEATETTNIYLDWLRDMDKIDSTASWCWNIIRLIYRLDDQP